jgi:hypothetical protein
MIDLLSSRHLFLSTTKTESREQKRLKPETCDLKY